MKITITFVISGCATRCDFCHSSAGRGPLMKADDFKRAVDVIADLVALLKVDGHEIFIGLMNEPILHPDFVEMANYARRLLPENFTWRGFEWATTGVPIAVRKDWEELLDTLMSLEVKELYFSLAGSEELHDRVVNRPGALKQQALAVARAKQRGFRTSVRVIVSKDMLNVCEQTFEEARRIGYDTTAARVSVYAPVSRLRAFEAQRPSFEDVEPHVDRLISFSQYREKDYWERIGEFTESRLLERVSRNAERYGAFSEMEARSPAWLFLDVLPQLGLYRGLYGAYTHRLGNLREDAIEALYARIGASVPNYEFAAFYDVGSLPSPLEIAKQFGDAGSSKLYRREEDVLLRWLDLATQAGVVNSSVKGVFDDIPVYR